MPNIQTKRQDSSANQSDGSTAVSGKAASESPNLATCKDTELMSLLKERHTSAAAELFKRHKGTLTEICGFMIRGDSHVVDDIVQKAFERVIERSHTFKSGYPVKPWLSGIVRHLCLDYLRAKGRSKEISETKLASTGVDNPLSLVGAPRVAPVEALIDQAMREKLAWAVEHLTQEHRDVIQGFLLGWSYEQIASANSIPIGTVKSRMNKAKEHLREICGLPKQKAA